MRFLMCVLSEGQGLATADEMADIDAFNETLVADGHWVMAAGIEPPTESAVFDHRGDQLVVTDGPPWPAPGYLAGFWIVTAADPAEARALAARAARACNRRIELRPLIGG